MFELIRRHALILAIFAAATTALTALVYQLTKERILQQAHAEQLALFSEVLPPELQSTRMLETCVLLDDPRLGKTPQPFYLVERDNKRVAAVLEVTAPDGYSGAIRLLVAADFSGKVFGVRTLEHHETPGLGDKIETRISDWITRFSGQQLNGIDDKSWAVKNDGGRFDQFTGATITPRAVVNATKRALIVLQELPDPLPRNLAKCGVNNG